MLDPPPAKGNTERMPRTEPPATRPPIRALSVGQILFLIGVLGLALIVGVTGYFAWTERKSLENNAQRDLRNTAFFLADHAGRLFEVASIALNSISTARQGMSWDDIAKATELQRRMRLTADALPQIEDIWLNDPTGVLRLTSFAYPTPDSNAVDRTVFKEVKDGKKGLVVGDLILGKVTRGATFLLAQRLDKPNGEFDGMVSVTADLGYFSNYWSRIKLPPGSTISLVRADNLEVLAQYPWVNDSQTRPKSPNLLTAYAALPTNIRRTTFETPTGALARIGELPLFVVIETPTDVVALAWHNWLWTVVPFAGLAFIGLVTLTFAGFVQSRRDVTAHRALERAQQQLIEANASLETTVEERTTELTETNEEVQRFAYIVSHDLRAPLVNIMGFTSELERLREELTAVLLPSAEQPAPAAEPVVQSANRQVLIEDFDEALGFIKSSIGKMDRLINAILALSRQGGRRFTIENLDMNSVIGEIIAATAHQIQEAGAEVSVSDLPQIASDRLAIEQIFSNLVDNALKYRRDGANHLIEIKGKASGSFIVYEVKDNGRGIPAEDHKRIFELFRRSGVQDRQGEGIGLAHVKALVRRLGGIISVDSALGEGSAFKVALPAKPREVGGAK